MKVSLCAGTNAAALQHLGVTPPKNSTAPKGKFTRFDINTAMQEVTGPLLRSRGLRYKKKMWSYRTAADALPPALAPLATAPAVTALHKTGATAAGRSSTTLAMGRAAEAGGGVPPHVSYCMMTFIIRNGIKSLKQGASEYEGYVDALVRRWGLPEEQRRRVQASTPLDIHTSMLDHACCRCRPYRESDTPDS